MFSFWRKPSEVTQPLLQPQHAITICHRNSILTKLDKIKEKMTAVDLKLAADLEFQTQEREEKICKTILFGVPTLTSAAAIGLIIVIVNQYIKASQATVKYNNDIMFDNTTCAKALNLSIEDDDLFCDLPDNTDQPMPPAMKACLPLMLEMCATADYEWVIAVAIVLSLMSLCCFYFIAKDQVQSSYTIELMQSLTNEEKRLLRCLDISWHISTKESFKAIDKLIQTDIVLPLPKDIRGCIDEYLDKNMEDVSVRIAVESARLR